MPHLHQHEEEKFFLNARGQREALPSIQDSPTKQLSVVVPSYNEEKRCKPFLILLVRGSLARKGSWKLGLGQSLILVGCRECTVGSCGLDGKGASSLMLKWWSDEREGSRRQTIHIEIASGGTAREGLVSQASLIHKLCAGTKWFSKAIYICVCVCVYIYFFFFFFKCL